MKKMFILYFSMGVCPLFLSTSSAFTQSTCNVITLDGDAVVDETHPVILDAFENGQLRLSFYVKVPYCTAFSRLESVPSVYEMPTFVVKLVGGFPCAYIYPTPEPRVLRVSQTIDIGRSTSFVLQSKKEHNIFQLVRDYVLREVDGPSTMPIPPGL